jgi:hypothetical protein
LIVATELMAYRDRVVRWNTERTQRIVGLLEKIGQRELSGDEKSAAFEACYVELSKQPPEPNVSRVSGSQWRDRVGPFAWQAAIQEVL